MSTDHDEVGGERQRRPARAAGREDGSTARSTLRRGGTGVLGAALLVRGLRRGRSLRGAATTLLGGWLVYRAATGSGGRNAERTLPGLAASERGEPGASEHAVEVRRSVTVDVPAEELHEYWRDGEKLAEIVAHFAEVEETDEGRYRWTLEAPWNMLLGSDRGPTLGWESRLSVDDPGEVLRWETVGDADIPNEGAIQFHPAPGDRGTEVELTLRFDPPGGPLGRLAVSVFESIPETIVATSLRRFKSLAETGEIPTLEGNPSARGRGDLV